MPLKDIEARRRYAREYNKERYQANAAVRENHKKLVAVGVARRRAAMKARVAVFRANGCLLCKETAECCLDAHHIDPSQKDFSIGDAARNVYGLDTLERELAKCVCLCRNCHAKVHAGIVVLDP